MTREELIDAGVIRPSRFDVPALATPEQVDAFLWARGINKPMTLVEHGLKLLRGGATGEDEDIAEKRKRKDRAARGIQTMGRL